MSEGLSVTIPSAICFDVGGTLIFADGVKIASLAEEMGLELEPQRCRDAFCFASASANQSADAFGFARGDSYVGAWASYAGVPEASARSLWSALHRSDTADTPLWDELNPEAPTVLAALAGRGIALAAVSNAEGQLCAELERAGLLRFFDVVVDSRLVGVEKPDPGIFEIALERLAKDAGRCWVVGNEYVFDLLVAREAGIETGILYDRLGQYGSISDCVRVSALSDLLVLLPE